MGIRDFIFHTLHLPNDVIPYHVARELAELYPDKTTIQGQNYNFDLEAFVCDEQCAIVEEKAIFHQFSTEWEEIGKRQKQYTDNAWLNVLWNGKLLDVIFISFGGSLRHHWIVADDRMTAESFQDAVCEWSCEVRGEILVFKDGFFEKDKELLDAIKGATFDNLVLRPSLKEVLQKDFDQFFNARDIYERYGIPWKRGAIFIGPPGNGKTHTVKALINQLEKLCIYVRGFKSQYRTEQENMAQVFQRARMTMPCIIVLEDLDAMITSENRAFFLNELDGFQVNTGVVVIATTNHPEKLDAAILDRPSRFDRKYQFNLPNDDERRAYVDAWNDKLQEELRISQAKLPRVVTATEGFSFAYLKELLTSSMVQWVSEERKQTMDEVICKQVEALRNQMGRGSNVVVMNTTVRRLKLFKRTAKS